MANENAQWWYERNGAQAGPVTFAVVQDLARTGQLKPSTMVWTAGMAGWTRAELVQGISWPPSAGVAEPTPRATPLQSPPAVQNAGTVQSKSPADPTPSSWGTPLPPADESTSSWGTPIEPARPARSAAEAVQSVPEVNIATTMLLAVITFSIYGVVKFFHTGKAYERLVGRETRFTTWFWVWVGTAAGAALLSAGGSRLGMFLSIAAVVFQFLTLSEALKARSEGLRRWGLQVPVTSDTTHYVLMALGMLLGPLFVGLILLVVQGVKWFQDWNAIRATALSRTIATRLAVNPQRTS